MTVTATADKTIIFPNQSVTFTVTASSDEPGFDSVYLYINGVKGADVNPGYGNKSLTYTHTFSSTGTYEVKFYHSNGVKYSNTVTVYVSTYAIEFEEASYHSCGSCTVSCVLTDNGVVMSGETVSLTGTGSTLTATTDSNGVATFNLTGISASATLTASYSVVFDTASLTYTNPNTLNGSLVCLGRRMASHLTTMGVVDADPSDGLTTLADKILDVEPSISGLDLETEITSSASSTSVSVGDTVTFTGTLSAYYDDETVTDVDLQGVLQGATVSIKEGSTVLATGTTDTTGAYSITNTFSTSGTHTVKVVFDGTDNFKDCESSTISITVASITPVVTTVSLTSDKSILSYADSETATLTATVLDQFNQPMENETVSFAVVGGSTIGSDTTDSNGEATVSYSSEGTGDITVQASIGMIVSESYAIEDCVTYDTTEHTKSYSSTVAETITSTTGLNDCLISLDLKSTTFSYSCVFGAGYNSEADQIGFGTTGSSGRIYRTLNGSSSHSDYGSNNDGTYYNLRFERTGTTLKLYFNNTLIDTSTNNAISSFAYLNFISWKNKTLYYKNLKVKPL